MVESPNGGSRVREFRQDPKVNAPARAPMKHASHKQAVRPFDCSMIRLFDRWPALAVFSTAAFGASFLENRELETKENYNSYTRRIGRRDPFRDEEQVSC